MLFDDRHNRHYAPLAPREDVPRQHTCHALQHATTARKGAGPGCAAHKKRPRERHMAARRRFGPSLRAPSGRGRTAVCTLLRGTPVGDTPARGMLDETGNSSAMYGRPGGTERDQRTRNQLGTQPNWLGLAEPWLRVMSRKVFLFRD